MIWRTSDRTALSRRTLPSTPFSASRLWGGSRSGGIRSADMAAPGVRVVKIRGLSGAGSDLSIRVDWGARTSPRTGRPWAWRGSPGRRPLLPGRALLEGDDQHLDLGLDPVAQGQRHLGQGVGLLDRVLQLDHVRLDQQVLPLESLADLGRA